MLKVVGRAPTPTSRPTRPTAPPTAVDWVDIADPNPTFPYTPGRPPRRPTTTPSHYVGNQGRAQGAAHFSRLEGATFTSGEIFFTSTQGGGAAETGPELIAGYGNGAGQVWSYDPRAATLTCHYQSPGPRRSSCPTTSPPATTGARSSSARTAPPTTTSAASPGDGRAVRHRAEPPAAEQPAARHPVTARSSRAPRSAPTARRCSSTSRRRGAHVRHLGSVGPPRRVSWSLSGGLPLSVPSVVCRAT